MFFVLSAVGIEAGVTIVVLVLVFTAVGLTVPAAPGAIGTYHVAVIFALNEIAGIDATLSQGAAILLHVTTYIPFTLIGMWFFLKSNVKLADVKRCS